MPQPSRHIRLDFRLPGETSDTPLIVVRCRQDGEIARISADDGAPQLPLPRGSVASIDARDTIEHCHDEQAWLAELARVIAPGGALLARVPLDNGVAWLDALNIYRYISDLVGRSVDDAPLETLPMGWHRHYRPAWIAGLIEAAGFDIETVEAEGLPLGELGHLTGLILSGFTTDTNASQRRLFNFRERLHHRPLMPLPRQLASRVTVHATRQSFKLTRDPGADSPC